MIFTFKPNNYYNWYAPQTESRYGEIGPFFDQEDFVKLKIILVETFSSIIFSKFDSIQFRFEDDEDNDFFLVWSSDGIEI